MSGGVVGRGLVTPSYPIETPLTIVLYNEITVRM